MQPHGWFTAHLSTVNLPLYFGSLTGYQCIDFKILRITFKILQGFAPSYLKNLVSILPASHYQLRRNNNGILLASPRFKTKTTMGIAR